MRSDWDFDISSLIGHIPIPRVCSIRQRFDQHEIADLRSHVLAQTARQLQGRDLAGKTVAITVGSRGISGLPEVLKAVIAALKDKGALPFLVPAMGSHAGADAEAQSRLIADLGITEAAMGAEIRSSMETVVIGRLADGTPVYCDKNAAAADAIVVVNKVKPHADFKGEVESGLCKMMAIGLGKRDGAALLHIKGFRCFPRLLPEIAQCYLESGRILFGVGIVENARDRPTLCEVIPPESLLERERALLMEARANMPRLRLNKVDVLVVDQIGKNISGQGMDPNVTGRTGSPVKDGFDETFIDRIVVLGLTGETHGVFAGLGMADISTLRVAEHLDFRATYVNEITSRVIPPARLPLFTQNDEQAIRLAIYVSDAFGSGDISLVHIRDTSRLEEIEVSAKALELMETESFDFSGGGAPVWHAPRFESGRLEML